MLIPIANNSLLVGEHNWLTCCIFCWVDACRLRHRLVLEDVPDQLRSLIKLLLEMVLVLIRNLIIHSWWDKSFSRIRWTDVIILVTFPTWPHVPLLLLDFLYLLRSMEVQILWFLKESVVWIAILSSCLQCLVLNLNSSYRAYRKRWKEMMW